jgi:hypothetical protein
MRQICTVMRGSQREAREVSQGLNRKSSLRQFLPYDPQASFMSFKLMYAAVVQVSKLV